MEYLDFNLLFGTGVICSYAFAAFTGARALKAGTANSLLYLSVFLTFSGSLFFVFLFAEYLSSGVYSSLGIERDLYWSASHFVTNTGISLFHLSVRKEFIRCQELLPR